MAIIVPADLQMTKLCTVQVSLNTFFIPVFKPIHNGFIGNTNSIKAEYSERNISCVLVIMSCEKLSLYCLLFKNVNYIKKFLLLL